MLRGCSSTLRIEGRDCWALGRNRHIANAYLKNTTLYTYKMSFDRNPPQPIPAQDTTDKSLAKSSTLGRLAKGIPEPYVVPLAGGAAGAVSGFVSCPLDVIKTKLQAQGGFKPASDGIQAATAAYRGVSGTAATIWKEEGIRGMYRGLGPMLLGYIPTWAVYLTVYNKSQAFFRTKTGVCPYPLRHVLTLTHE